MKKVNARKHAGQKDSRLFQGGEMEFLLPVEDVRAVVEAARGNNPSLAGHISEEVKNMFKTLEMMKKRDERGFTLIELLIVIAIIAILAAIAIPQFSQYRERAIRASMIADARNAATNLEAIFADCQAYPGLTAAAGTTTSYAESGLTNCAGSAATVNFTASKGNTITIIGGANTYSIAVANAGNSLGDLALTGGSGTATPGCKFGGKTPC